jgi:hypothetical protein
LAESVDDKEIEHHPGEHKLKGGEETLVAELEEIKSND